jgi:hypothetical protein
MAAFCHTHMKISDKTSNPLSINAMDSSFWRFAPEHQLLRPGYA